MKMSALFGALTASTILWMFFIMILDTWLDFIPQAVKLKVVLTFIGSAAVFGIVALVNLIIETERE